MKYHQNKSSKNITLGLYIDKKKKKKSEQEMQFTKIYE